MRWNKLISTLFTYLAPFALFGSGVNKESLFSTPECISMKVSPDGAWTALIGSDQRGIPNVFIIDREGKRTQCSFFDTPEIIQFYWSPDSRQVLLIKDRDGKGSPHLLGVHIETHETKNYTEDLEMPSAKLLQCSKSDNACAVALKTGKSPFHDIYRLDLDTGERQLIYRNEGYIKFLLSKNLDILLKVRLEDDGAWRVLTEDDREFLYLSAEDAFMTELLEYDESCQEVVFLDSRYTDKTTLTAKSLATFKERVLGGKEDADVHEVLFVKSSPIAYSTFFEKKQWHVLDPNFQEAIAYLSDRVGTGFSIINQSADGRQWITLMDSPDRGREYGCFDLETSTWRSLYTPLKLSFAKMYSTIAKARDGKDLVTYYTLPVDADQGGTTRSPLPLIVFPHGGPFKARDCYAFHPFHQWFASLGYAVVSVNYRLSAGYGKSFVNAGNGEWGGAAHHDVLDAVEHCIAMGIADRKKMAIVGGSYGGYEAQASLAFSPGFFCCGVAICGPSCLETVLKSVPKYWEFTSSPLSDQTAFFTKQAFITSIGGDPENPDGAAYLRSCSPLYHLDAIRDPLLLVHGESDHVVTKEESMQIYQSMKERGCQVRYLAYPDEGHRFAKFVNKMHYMSEIEAFLSRYLEEKEPVANRVKGSSCRIFE